MRKIRISLPRLVLLCVAVFAVCAVAGMAIADTEAAESKFDDPARIANAMDNNPRRCVAMLDNILTPEQAAEFESALFPPATDAEKKAALENAKLGLKRAGIVMPEIDSAIALIADKPVEAK